MFLFHTRSSIASNESEVVIACFNKGSARGSSQSVLTSTFTSYIRPVIDYGSELLVTASDSALSKLDVAQNKAFRFITGAATFSPIAAMQLQTEISGPSKRHQYSAFSLANLDLVAPVHKHNSLLAELRSAALATIHERYPDQDWLHVFTDDLPLLPLVGLELVLSPTLLILKNLLVHGQTILMVRFMQYLWLLEPLLLLLAKIL
ncbi:uncharacterized protein LOC103524116 [Trichonephila clavipes]|nr:uncharacterized protein LOC103524116 [Trichonephila clavipes]